MPLNRSEPVPTKARTYQEGGLGHVSLQDVTDLRCSTFNRINRIMLFSLTLSQTGTQTLRPVNDYLSSINTIDIVRMGIGNDVSL